MSWLARIRLDYAQAHRLRLHDSYAWHQAAWRAFPDRDGQPRDFLMRLEPRDRGFELLLLSREEPVRPSWCPEAGWGLKAIPAGFLDHRRFRFDLRANPTRKVVKQRPDGSFTKNGRRVPLTRPDEQLAWLERKSGDNGFRLPGESAVVADPDQDHPFRKGDSRGLHVGVRYRGVLDVVDKERFREAFFRGIGSAKAFGFGMLLLQPIV